MPAPIRLAGPSATELEAKLRAFIAAKAEALIEQHCDQIRTALRDRVGEVVTSIVTEATVDGPELVIRVRVGTP